MTIYDLTTFFDTVEESKRASKLINADNDHILVFKGSGGNGKSQLIRQLLDTNRDRFVAYHESVISDTNRDLRNRLNEKKKVIVATNQEDLTLPLEFTYDVIEFTKVF
jgi:replication-associated recombination protein RarA